jgi:hypothetical protein
MFYIGIKTNVLEDQPVPNFSQNIKGNSPLDIV